MQIGDLVKVKWTEPTDPNMGIVMEIIQYGSVRSKFAKVTLTNGYVGTYRVELLEVLCK